MSERTSCEGCPLGGPQCYGTGPNRTELVLVGESPGRTEVAKGTPFVGPSGALLNAILRNVGYDRDRTYVTNTTLCRPTDASGKDAPPNAATLAACHRRLVAEVRAREPKVVLAVGGTAAGQLIGDPGVKITDVQGAMQWSDEYDAYVLPTFHPAAVLHGNIGYFDDIWLCIRRAVLVATGQVPPPPKRLDLRWSLLREPAHMVPILEELLHRPERPLSIDTESVAPHDQPRPLSDTWLMSQIYNGHHAYAFDMLALLDYHVSRHALEDLLACASKIWIMHNKAYDLQVFRANAMPHPIDVRDTMALGLGLTERGEQVGLEALSRTYAGAPFYKKQLHAHGFAWGRFPENDQQWYDLGLNGCRDAYYTYQLAQVLPPLVKAEGTMQLVRDLLHPAAEAFADVQHYGAKVDLDWAQELVDEWQPLIDAAQRALEEYAASVGFRATDVSKNQVTGAPCPDCVPKGAYPRLLQNDRKEWREMLSRTRFGDPSCTRCMKRRFILVPDDTFNPNAAGQRQHLALNVLNMKKVKGNSVDKDFFAYHAAHPFSQLMGDYSEMKHLMSNYILGITDDVWADGRIHPDFLLFGTVTGRLSIHNPPMQTIPKWGVDPKKAKLIRKLFVGSEIVYASEVIVPMLVQALREGEECPSEEPSAVA